MCLFYSCRACSLSLLPTRPHQSLVQVKCLPVFLFLYHSSQPACLACLAFPLCCTSTSLQVLLGSTPSFLGVAVCLFLFKVKSSRPCLACVFLTLPSFRECATASSRPSRSRYRYRYRYRRRRRLLSPPSSLPPLLSPPLRQARLLLQGSVCALVQK